MPTINELIEKDIACVYEDEGYFYIRLVLAPGINYDDSMWKIDKQTKEVSYLDYTAFMIDYQDEAIEINPSDLKERLK